MNDEPDSTKFMWTDRYTALLLLFVEHHIHRFNISLNFF